MRKKHNEHRRRVTDRQERLCQEYVFGEHRDKPAKSAEAAGYCRSWGHRLLRQKHIQARVAELRNQRIEENEGPVTVEWLMQEYRNVYFDNRESNPQVAKAALDSIVKLMGGDQGPGEEKKKAGPAKEPSPVPLEDRVKRYTSEQQAAFGDLIEAEDARVVRLRG